MNTTAPNVDFATMLMAMLVIIGLILACAWVLKRINGNVGFNNRLIKVKSVTNLGVKEKLVLVDVGEKQLLLGVTPNQITMLKEIDFPLATAQQTETSPFSDKLKMLLRGSDKWQHSGESSKD